MRRQSGGTGSWRIKKTPTATSDNRLDNAVSLLVYFVVQGIKVDSFPKCDFIPVDYYEVRHVKSSFKKLMRACAPSSPFNEAERGFLKAVEETEWLPQVETARFEQLRVWSGFTVGWLNDLKTAGKRKEYREKTFLGHIILLRKLLEAWKVKMGLTVAAAEHDADRGRHRGSDRRAGLLRHGLPRGRLGLHHAGQKSRL